MAYNSDEIVASVVKAAQLHSPAPVVTFVFLAITAALGIATYHIFQFFITPLLWAVLVGSLLHPYKQSLSLFFRASLLGKSQPDHEKEPLPTVLAEQEEEKRELQSAPFFTLSIIFLPFVVLNRAALWLLDFILTYKYSLFAGSVTLFALRERDSVNVIARLLFNSTLANFYQGLDLFEDTFIDPVVIQNVLTGQVVLLVLVCYIGMAALKLKKGDGLVMKGALVVSSYLFWAVIVLKVLPFLCSALGSTLVFAASVVWIVLFLIRLCREMWYSLGGWEVIKATEWLKRWQERAKNKPSSSTKETGTGKSDETAVSTANTEEKVVQSEESSDSSTRMGGSDRDESKMSGRTEPMPSPSRRGSAMSSKGGRRQVTTRKSKARSTKGKTKKGGKKTILAKENDANETASQNQEERASEVATSGSERSMQGGSTSRATWRMGKRTPKSITFFAVLFFCVALQVFYIAIFGLVAWALAFKCVCYLVEKAKTSLDDQVQRARYAVTKSSQWVKENMIPSPIRFSYHIICGIDQYMAALFSNYVDFITSVLTILAVVMSVALFFVFLAVQLRSEGAIMAGSARWMWKEQVLNNTDMWTTLRTSLGLSEDMMKEAMSSGIDRVIDSTGESVMDLAKSIIGANIDLSLLVGDQTMYKSADMFESHGLLNRSSRASSVEIEEEWKWIKDGVAHFVETGRLPPSVAYANVKALVSFDALKTFATSNVALISSVGKKAWELVQSNASSASQVVFWAFTSIIYASQSIVNFFFTLVLFFTALYYLLDAKGDDYLPIDFISSMLPFTDKPYVTRVLRNTIQSVFESNLKMALFYGLYYWLIFTVFDFSVVVLPSLLSALIAVVPVLVIEWVAVPGIVLLWFVANERVDAVLFAVLAFLPRFYVVTAIYSEIDSSHHYITGLAILGGLYLFGVGGVLLGPLLVCVLFIAMDVYRTQFTTRLVDRTDVEEATMKQLKAEIERGLKAMSKKDKGSVASPAEVYSDYGGSEREITRSRSVEESLAGHSMSDIARSISYPSHTSTRQPQVEREGKSPFLSSDFDTLKREGRGVAVFSQRHRHKSHHRSFRLYREGSYRRLHQEESEDEADVVPMVSPSGSERLMPLPPAASPVGSPSSPAARPSSPVGISSQTLFSRNVEDAMRKKK